jgi:hypothetical protein
VLVDGWAWAAVAGLAMSIPCSAGAAQPPPPIVVPSDCSLGDVHVSADQAILVVVWQCPAADLVVRYRAVGVRRREHPASTPAPTP